MATDDISARSAPTNLYEQVREDLLRRIREGDFNRDKMLPSEEELCRQYGVSTITMRRAIADLAAQFVVIRKRGVGTIITDRPPSRRAFHLTGVLDHKTTIRAEQISDRLEKADAEIARRLELQEGDAIHHIRAIARRNKEPFTFIDAYTPDALSPSRESNRRQTKDVGAKLVRRGRIERAEQDLDAVAADSLAAKWLDLTPGLPIMRARRVYFNADGVPVRYIIIKYHPERYQFTVDLRPAAGAPVFDPTTWDGAGRSIEK